jgi:hypothetical protein
MSGAHTAQANACSLRETGLSFHICFVLTHSTVVGTAAHLNLTFLPVDLRVMFAKPGEAQYDVLFPEAGHCERGSF